MPKKNNDNEKKIGHYTHDDKERVNNPPVGLVSAETDHLNGRKKYQHDPHIDPQLVWAGKVEGTSFEVDTISLHVHEKIDPLTIIENVKKEKELSMSLFPDFEQNIPLREAVEFYKHKHSWSNRLVAGDSLLVMNSLLEKEGMAGKVQMIYIDPPYGIKYGSNFQPFVNKRDVKDNKDEDLTQEPETIKAFRDTWELGIHSYLSYLRDRLLLARELLIESGSVFVQISDENVHHVREICDEIFGVKNFVSIISFTSTSGIPGITLSRAGDYIIWFSKDKNNIKYKQLYTNKDDDVAHYNLIVDKNGIARMMKNEERENLLIINKESKLATSQSLTSQGETKSDNSVEIEGKIYKPGSGQHWKTTVEGIINLYKNNRLIITGNSIRYLRYKEDFTVNPINNIWFDTVIGSQEKNYVVQTSIKVIQRCLLMTTDPGDLVLDPTCGSGTTAYVAEQWGRRWITCDTSRVAVTLAKQRLMTAVYDYYELAHPSEGIASGFKYKTVPHVTLKSIANNEPPATETLYDQPFVETKKKRVSGPFTVEAVPSQRVRSIDSFQFSVDSFEKEDTENSKLKTQNLFLIINKRRIAPYERFKIISGLDSLEKINELSKIDLYIYAILSQGRDLWDYFADQTGYSFSTGEYSRRAIKELEEGIPSVSWNSKRFSFGDGDIIDDLKGFGISDGKSLRQSINRLRGNSKTSLFIEEISERLELNIKGDFQFSVDSFEEEYTENSKLKTQNSFTADNSVSRSGETSRQNEWIEELRATGVRGKSGQKIEFTRIDILPATRWIHAEGETKEGEKIVVSFGPEYAPLEQRQVELAIEEAQSLVPKPKIIIFTSFQFDPEASKDIDELKWPGVNILKAQMNTDLLTGDLKKKRSNNESFWLIGQPDVELVKKADKYIIKVKGFDYYNTRTGQIESGDTSKIALWELDTDYDGRSLYPRQIFFIMEPGSEQLEKLARNLKGFINEELIEKFFGTESLPFAPGKNKRTAVKIIDDRGIESIKIINIKE